MVRQLIGMVGLDSVCAQAAACALEVMAAQGVTATGQKPQ
jgi:hypothetical protein